MRSKRPRETKIIGDKRTQGRQGLLCPTSLLLNSNGDPSSRIRILGQAPRQSRECRPNFLKCSSSCIRIFFALRFYPCHWVYHVFGNSPPCFESFKTSKKNIPSTYPCFAELLWSIVVAKCETSLVTNVRWAMRAAKEASGDQLSLDPETNNVTPINQLTLAGQQNK